MNQGILSLDPPAAGEPAGAALQDDRLLLALAAANDAFLRLVAELPATRPAEAALGLEPRPLQALAAIGHHRRNALAGLPFLLFDLRFRDDRWWDALAAGAAAVNDGVAVRPPDARATEFARFALLLAWYLAQTSQATARLALGAGDGALRTLRSLPLGAADALAPALAGCVTARFGGSEPFWRLFVQCAIAPDAEVAGALRLLGLQLMGMDAARARGLDRRGRRLALP